MLEWDGRTAAALLADDAAEAADQCGLGDILLAKNAKERQEKVEAYRSLEASLEVTILLIDAEDDCRILDTATYHRRHTRDRFHLDMKR